MAFFGEVAMSATVLPSSDTRLAGLAISILEDGHEGRGLTEVAGADDVSVDAQPFRVVPRLNAPGDVQKRLVHSLATVAVSPVDPSATQRP